MKKTSKWPSRAFNLLMVLAMVISLSAILVAPSSVAAAVCNPTPVWNGCHIEVAVNTYIKTEAGDFIAQTSFSPTNCFYVNAVVVNTGNATAFEPVNATIVLPSGVSLATGETYSKIWALGNLTYASPEGLMADFWWKVCCSSANGSNKITVNVTTGPGGSGCGNSSFTTVNQGLPPGNKCLDIEIVEAPGMPDKVGELGNYHMTMPGTVNPCTSFGIKAEITNRCTSTLTGVLGNISWTGQADGPVGGDPLVWELGTLAPGETKAVGWTLHCTGPGTVVVTVDSPSHPTIVNKIDDPWTVHQTAPGGLKVTITQPVCSTTTCNPTCVIKQPSGDCGAENFIVNATVQNTGDAGVANIFAVVGTEPSTGWAHVTSASIFSLGTLAAGQTVPVSFTMHCDGNGTGNVTVQAYSATNPTLTNTARVAIAQKYTIATASPDPAYRAPTTVNKCQEFDVTFRYMNYSGSAWNDDSVAPGSGNITACIYWNGNATMADSVYYRRVVGGVPEAWLLLTSSPVVTGNDSVGYTSCVHIPVICNCCGVEVRWHFQCTDVGAVKFYSTINVQQVNPLFIDSDTSENVCVNQVWKAHLTGDNFFFIQDEHDVMVMQDAVVPGNYFHVVIPVMNTGDATATNVQVYFIITDSPEGNCTQSYELISSSGDAVSVVPQGGGAYIATFNSIPGHKAVKATLLLHCLCEGHVTVWIPDAVVAWGGVKGIRGIDANTNAAIPQANMVVPPCPRELEQIPFTVVIENPVTCQNFNAGVTFPVKAKITNGSTEDLVDVSATLSWGPGDPVQLMGNQTPTKDVGNITAGSSKEITWELLCTGGGDVDLFVSATSETPLLVTYSDDRPDLPGNQPVTVHQILPPGACLDVTMLSPGPNTWIATGQEFAVSAKVYNDGPDAAVNVIATIDDYNYPWLHYVTLVDGESAAKNLGTIADGDFEVVTWTLWGGSDSDYMMRDCTNVTDTIEVNATTDTQRASNCSDDAYDTVTISVYPAAFLVATIDSIAPVSPITVGSQFIVDYTVTNYGVADALNVLVALSTDSKVSVAADTGGYTQFLSTIAGWTWGEPYNSVSGSFTLQGTDKGLSTFTVTPTGDDECGWQPKDPPFLFIWTTLPGDQIRSQFLIPVSETINLIPSGGADLSITKTVDNASPNQGATVNFTVTVTNNGPADATGVVVTDSQPSGLTFGAATASQGSFASGVWTVGNLVAGGSASLVIPATVTNAASPITNTATVTGAQFDLNATNNSAKVVLNGGKVTSASFTLNAGWNLISLPLIPNNGNITVMLASVWSSFDNALTYDAATATWSSYIRVGGPPSQSMIMADGKGYWIHMSAAGTVTFNGVVAADPPALPKSYNVVSGWNLIGFKSLVPMAAGSYLNNVQYVRIWSFANGAYSPITSSDMMQPGLGYWVAIVANGIIFP